MVNRHESTSLYFCCMRKKNRSLFLIAFTSILTIVIFPENAPGNQSPLLYSYHPTDSFTILSWNVFLLPKWTTWFQPHRNYNWKKRTISIIELLEKQNADIVVLQEAFNHAAVEMIKQKLSHKYLYVSEPIGKFSLFGAGSGLLLLSKFPIQSLHTIEYKDCASDDCFASKGAFRAEFFFQNKINYIIGTHLQADYKYPTQYQSVRALQLKQLYTTLGIEDSNSTVFYCGDFNIDYYHQQESRNLMQTLKVNNPCINPGEFTWQEYDEGSEEKYYYDYCLVKSSSSNFNCSLKILHPNSIMRPSDHLPVALTYNHNDSNKLKFLPL